MRARPPYAKPAPGGAPPDPRSPSALVEELGELFDRTGSSRISGRIVGWLLVCEPEHQTADEIRRAVHASKGSASTVLRHLVELGLVERIGLSGDRRAHFRLRDDGWTVLFETKMSFTHVFRELAERWDERLKGDRSRRARVTRMAAIYRFFDDELAAVLARWRARADARRA